MASNSQTVPKLLRNLRDNGKFVLQCGALTYIRSNTEKLDTNYALSKEEYAEICKLIMELTIDGDQNMRNEATKALHAVLKFFKKHSLKFFESALHIEREKRLKIFQFLEAVDDASLTVAVNDPSTINFIKDCLIPVQVTLMEWLSPNACTDNLRVLEAAENKVIAGPEEIEEILVHNALTLLQRIYQTGASCVGNQALEKFDMVVMDKAVPLAYMGHKRQRSAAIKLLFQAIDTDLSTRLKTKHPNVYSKYKNNVEGHYSARMMLLVKACEADWSSLWAISIRILGTDLHRGAPLINKLLSVEERAFKSTDPAIRREAFVSWKLLVDNLALDMKELTTKRRVKLLCVPLTANNSKSELIALTKLEVWWYLISKLYQHIVPFADPVVTQFLNFCFGPLGDTPLLSTKFDVIPSPGKRFYKTKIDAVDALLQLFVANQNEQILMAPILEERLPSSMSDELFKQCYKAFIHSVGEAVMIISKLDDNDMSHREEICKILWLNLMRYVRTTNQEIKKNVYNELILLISELQIRSLKMEFLNDFLRNTIIPELAGVAGDLVYYDGTLVNLMTKIMVPTFLTNLQGKQSDAVKCLMWQTVRPETLTNYHPDTLQFLATTLQQLRSIPVDTNSLTDCFELWFAYADIIFKYMKALQDVNEGTGTETNFKTIESIISFPYTHMYWANSMQAQKIAVHWKDVYKKYECQADTIANIKPNQIFNNTTKIIEESLTKNEKCYRIAVYCLDALMATINYKVMLAQSNIPTIVRLVGDLTAITLHEGQPSEAECALRALSSLLITVYGHSPEKVLSYMKVTSPTVELMLEADADDAVVKEITSTWETIVSILRGLSNILDEKFLVSYTRVISLSLKHTNTEISSQSVGILDLKDSVKENGKWVLAELAQEGKKTSIKDSSKLRVEKSEKTPKGTRVAGSFLNRKSTSPRTFNRAKEESEKKLAPLPPEPDSQDYVIIRSENQLDVDRLTEHQKEIFKKRRDDIPAMYNDLSQSSSQDTQDLQHWFGGKKIVNEPQQKTVSSDTKCPKGDTKTTNFDPKTSKGDAKCMNVGPKSIVNAKIPKSDTKSTVVDAKVSKVDTKSTIVDPKVSKIDTKSAIVDAKISKIDTKSTVVDAKIPKIDTKSTIVDAKIPKIDTKSTIVDAKTPKIDTTSAIVDTKIPKIDTASTKVDAKLPKIDTTSSKVDPTTVVPKATVETKPPQINTKSTNVDTKTSKVETKATNVGPKDPKVDTKSTTVDSKDPKVDTKSTNVDPKTSKVEPKSTYVGPKDPKVDTKSTTVDAKDPKVDTKSTTVDPKIPKVDTKPTDVDSKTSKIETKSTGVDSKTQKIDAKSTTIDTKIAKVETKSTSMDPKAPKIVTEMTKVGPKSSKVDEKLATINTVENPTVSLEKIMKISIGTKTTELHREPEEKVWSIRKSPETISSSGQDPSNDSILLRSTTPSQTQNLENKKSEETRKSNNLSPTSDESCIKETKSPDSSEHAAQESFAKKLNFESREEYPEEEKNVESLELRSSNKTSRSRRSGKVSGSNMAEEKPQQPSVPKGVSTRGKTIVEGEPKAGEIEENVTAESRGLAGKSKGNGRSVLTTAERGTKRKAFSDVENEDSGGEQEKKRRKSSRSPSGSEDSTTSQTAKRTDNEISRLRIDMVSDGPLRSRRRSKYLDNFVNSERVVKRTHSPEVRGKGTRSRGSSNPRKMAKSAELDDAGKRRRTRFTKFDEDEKTERRKENEAGGQVTKPLRSTRSKQRKSVQESGAASESQLITDDDEPIEEFKSTNDEDTSKESVKDPTVKLDVPEKVAIPETPVNPVEEPSETQMELDFDEVVESSQDTSVLTASHKRAFAKIVKLMNTEEQSAVEVPVETSFEKKLPTASSPINSSSTEKKDESEVNIAEDPDETFLDISAIRPQLADDVPVEDPQKKAPEASKTSTSPVPTKPDASLHYSSPKTHTKCFIKPKTFVPQGRGAHMLGLVTKLGVLEKEISSEKNQVDEEVVMMSKIEKSRSIARSRAKENEGETAISRRTNIVREPERIGSPSGSRQEKIFNNMKSADYAASPPAKMFCNLKNNGEKISPKMEKSQVVSQENGTAGRDDEMNISLASEREELPMLEWSSANPPSLTASPSVSILKRNRSIVSEIEPDPTTPNRVPRKRVSFADPPVSKEMGYEIEVATSPHKITKYNTSRGLLGRRDSPIRMKQSRFVMIQVDTEKSVETDEPQILSCDVDVNCARDNELLVRIAEDLEETINFQTPEKIGSPESNFIPEICMEITGAYETVELEQIPVVPEKTIVTSCPSVKNVPIEETQTQDDLFNSSDEKNDSPKQPGNRRADLLKESFDISSTSMIDSFKLNVTEYSVIGSITDVRAEATKARDINLEDTVDARNVILSLEENLNEQFDAIPVRTSTQGPDLMNEMDTLPVTDSILNSQPNTIDSQASTQPVLEISRPELLDSTEPIYPNLGNCEQPIDSIIDNLTNPLWRKNLSKYLETRCIRTVGDLAKLSEREIVRIPVKGTSKIHFVRKVLEKYESKLRDSEAEKQASHDLRSERLAGKTTTQNDVELSDDLRKTLGDISLDNSKIQSDSIDLDTSVLRPQPTNDFLSIDDLNPLQPLARTSTTNSISTVVIDSTDEMDVTAELDDTASISRMKTIDLASDTLPVSTKSVATSTSPPLTSDKSVETQFKVEELVDLIDVDVLLKSVVKRVSAEKLLMEYKLKMGQTSETDICKKTLEALGFDNETLLKLACRECGLKKLLCEIPNIFNDTNFSNC